jgi:hypothetical protein
MTGLKWFDGYSGESTDELIALEGEYRADSLVLAFEQAVQLKAGRRGSGSLMEEETTILAVEALEREVNNGGYGQFFINSSKEYAPIVVDALRRIASTEVATLTQDAINALGIEGPVTIKAIDLAMEEENTERDDALEACDERYYKVVGDLAGRLFQFIKSNRREICLNE